MASYRLKGFSNLGNSDAKSVIITQFLGRKKADKSESLFGDGKVQRRHLFLDQFLRLN